MPGLPTKHLERQPVKPVAMGRILATGGTIATLVLAFVLTFLAGQRGFYAFDQSIVFDGSWRILQGQVPYRDFVLPFGPGALWLQVFFFRLLGMTYFAYIVGAASVNVLAVLAAMVIVKILFPFERGLAFVAGILTAFWFYPPFGTPWVDQTAFFFSFVALCSLLAGVLPEGRFKRGRKAMVVASGCLVFVAFISKQNVGSFIFPLYPLVLVLAGMHGRRRAVEGLMLFLAGLAASAAAFAVWVVKASDPAVFTTYVLGLASGLGRERLAGFIVTRFGLLSPFFGGRGPLLVILIAWGALAISAAMVAKTIVRAPRDKGVRRQDLIPAVVCIYLVGFQHVFTNTTLNQPENGLAFIGIVLATAFGLALRIAGGRIRILRAVLWVGVGAVLTVGSIAGFRTSMDRKVHDIFRGSRFGGHLPVEGLRGLRWARPTRMGGFEITEEEVVGLWGYLKRRDERFFIFPDFTIMYGLLGKPSPQPLLWFHGGVTYDPDSNSDLDRWIVEDLQRNHVRIFVLEQVAWFNTGDRLDDFPQMKAFLRSEFARVGQIGSFSIHEKNPVIGNP